MVMEKVPYFVEIILHRG